MKLIFKLLKQKIMKKINAAFRFAALLICFCLPASLIAQKNYISIESGLFFGGPANKIESQMNTSGFNDNINYSFDLFNLFQGIFGLGFQSVNLNDQYPKNKNNGGKYWIRYSREMKNKKIIELSYGKVHKSTVEGFDITKDGDLFEGNRLNYTNDISAITAHYIFPNKKGSAGIGLGPALAFTAITTQANTTIEKKNNLQPGISGAAYWRFINKKVFFMSLRGDAMLLAPATIDAITLTSPNGINSTFNTTKINSFVGDLTVSVGFKF